MFNREPVRATREMDATFEQLALRHGGVKIDLFWLLDEPRAYVRAPTGERYDVSPTGREQQLPDNDRRPYEED
jgi:hypothetical protein